MTAPRQTGRQSAAEQCGWLTAWVAAAWLVLAGPAWLVAGTLGLEGLSYAALLGLIPGWLVFWFASRYGTANIAAKAVLGGMVLRMLVVLAGIALVSAVRPMLGIREFVMWVLVFYLVSLAVETVLVLRNNPA